MKRIVCIFFIILILLASCAPQEVEPAPPIRDYPAPEGLFVYYNLSDADLAGPARYGLVNAMGELAVDCEYDKIDVLRPYIYHDYSFDLPADRRFFTATIYDAGDSDEDMPSMTGKMALISPEGNFLTGFVYSDIGYIIDNPIEIIARRADDPGQLVKLNHYGAESEIEDEAVLSDLIRQHRRLWADGEEVLPEGQDVPVQGFDWILPTGSGNYWGAATSDVISDGPPTKSDYLEEIRLYSQNNVLVNGDVFHFLGEIGDDLYVAGVYTGDRNALYASESYIVNQNGKRLAGPYDRFQYWGASSYLLGISGQQAYVLAVDGFQELLVINIPEDGWIETSAQGGRPFASINSRSHPAVICMLDTGEQFTLNGLGGYIPESHNGDMTRLVLRPFDDMERGLILCDRKGKIIASGYDRMYGQYGLLYAGVYGKNGTVKCRLLDWDGNDLMDMEFSALEILPGNALLVVRGDSVGIMDLGGNWIYQQSVFQHLED